MRKNSATKRKFSLSTTQIILIGFMAVILVGSGLLTLPISSKTGESVGYLDALFTSTSATCVTGLVTLPTVSTWSVFGQIVILILIQIGGLGVITVTAGIMLAFHRKFRLKDNLLIGDAFNISTLSGLRAFVKKVLVGVFLIEGVGALLYMTVFVPDFGVNGIWISIFNSVSAFCNAGLDIVSETSLYAYAGNPIVNSVTCLLIVTGGIGYIVWWDILRVFRQIKKHKGKWFCYLTLHSKIVLTATLTLILGGALLIFLFEYNNPLTLGEYSLYDKIQISFFQSVTTRTAGFATIPQENLTGATSIVCILLMFIGGSPVGTAGGIKTTTIVILLATCFSSVRGENETSLYHRSLTRQTVRKAVAVAGTSFIILFVSTVLLSLTTSAPTLDVVYETVSATATVGLSRNFTYFLSNWGKLIIIFTMFFGRVGPITLAVIFQKRNEQINNVKNPTEEVSVG